MSQKSQNKSDKPKRTQRPLTPEQREKRNKRVQADIVQKLVKYGAGPEIIYAFKKTGLLILLSQIESYPPADVLAWLQAIAEYRQLAAEGAEQIWN